MKYFNLAVIITAAFILSGCVVRTSKEPTITSSIVIVPDSQYKAGERQ
ncbi:MAG: hypothetical protein LBP54_08640 [Campylobacteraceae bacterium]|nr:hypothetical protein [Campylobacteraceae bacterium]